MVYILSFKDIFKLIFVSSHKIIVSLSKTKLSVYFTCLSCLNFIKTQDETHWDFSSDFKNEYCVCLLLGVEPGALHVLGKHLITGLHF